MNNIPKSELWVGLKAAAAAFGVKVTALRTACKSGAVPTRRLSSGGYGEVPALMVRLADVESWAQANAGLLPGRPAKSAQLLARIRSGAASGETGLVETLCTELGMTRGAVLRAWQRECRRDSGFPRRDPATDGAVPAAKISDEKLSREQKKSGPWENTVKLPSPSSLLKAIRSSGLSANSLSF